MSYKAGRVNTELKKRTQKQFFSPSLSLSLSLPHSFCFNKTSNLKLEIELIKLFSKIKTGRDKSIKGNLSPITRFLFIIFKKQSSFILLFMVVCERRTI